MPDKFFDGVEHKIEVKEERSNWLLKTNQILYFFFPKINHEDYMLIAPYFDSEWYCFSKNIAYDKIVPIEHFFNHSHKYLSTPNPLFDSTWYYKKYLMGKNPSIHPLLHYIKYGYKLGYNPNSLFWSTWYAETYMGNLEHICPLFHYLMYGKSLNSNPNPLFNGNFYENKYSYNHVLYKTPLSHYLNDGWKELNNTHPMFDSNYYLSQIGLETNKLNVSLLQYLLENKNSPSCHVLFDVAFYREQAKQRQSEVHPIIDYLTVELNNINIDPHPFFSRKYYYKNSTDIFHKRIEALTHYLSSGYLENRKVHPLFDNEFYVEFISSTTINPLVHYIEYGYETGLPNRLPEPPNCTIKLTPSNLNIMDISTNILLDNQSLNKTAFKIGAFLHIFYPELTNEILEGTNNIPSFCNLYISTDAIAKAKEIELICEKNSCHPFEIRVLPNRGRDIAPMLVGFQDKLQQVDYAVHIHSKKSLHETTGKLKSWRDYLISNNLGTKELVLNILTILSNEKIGAYVPDHHLPIKELIQWGGNFKIVSAMLEHLGQKITRDSCLYFPSGSMFWFKPKALKPLFDMNLRFYHFDAEQGQVDGTLAHAIERSFLYFIEYAGYEWVAGVASNEIISSKINILSNRFMPSNVDLGELRHYYPECTYFLVRPNLIKKPRLNLIVPIDISMGYAGVSTAFDIFYAIKEQLSEFFDFRIIKTDYSTKHTMNYELINPLDNDIEGKNVEIKFSHNERTYFPFFVRDNDIFLATAWWTAVLALNILKQQNIIFPAKQRQFIYLIQDFECGFYNWSTKYALVDYTYRHPEQTIPIFNTDILFNFFKEKCYYHQGYVLKPAINDSYSNFINYKAKKEKIVLLYARPHAERNCLPFLDILVSKICRESSEFWNDWRFLAIGEDFDSTLLKSSQKIEILGRLKIDQYALLASKSALAISLMVSPHPSYPPLEMAEAGVLVLTNNYDLKDLSKTHDNLFTFSVFDIDEIAKQFESIAKIWLENPDIGWLGKSKIDYFYNSQTNLAEIANHVANKLIEISK